MSKPEIVAWPDASEAREWVPYAAVRSLLNKVFPGVLANEKAPASAIHAALAIQWAVLFGAAAEDRVAEAVQKVRASADLRARVRTLAKIEATSCMIWEAIIAA